MSELLTPLRLKVSSWDLGGSAVNAGRGLLLVTGLVVVCSVGALHPSSSDWGVITLTSVAMLGVLLASFAVPWRALHCSVAFLFPAAAIGGLAALGRFTEADIGSCYAGLFVLCFAYTGAFLPRRSSYPLAMLAAPAFVAVLDQWNPRVAIRLCIATAVWVILGELVAALVRRQQAIAALLAQTARTDELTGVGNRRDVDEHVRRTRVGDTIVVCDLDHFKAVNDTFGHAAGDQVLRDFGAALLGALRGDDYAGRFGGEEFVLILADTDQTETGQVLSRLHRRWAALGHHVTFSAGYSTRSRGTDAADVLLSADRAVYAAKGSGRDRDVCEITAPNSMATARDVR